MDRANLKPIINTISQEKVVQKWLKGLRTSSTTYYLTALADFCQVTTKTPQEMLDIAWQEQENRVSPWQLQIDEWFTAYKDYCHQRNYAKQTCQGRRTVVSTFFHMFKINTPRDLTKREKGKLIVKNRRKGLTKEDITQAINACHTFKMKALILTQCTSGMAESDVLKLKMNQFKEGLIKIDDDHSICKIHEKRTKSLQEHITFINFEAVELIQKYIELERGKYQLKGALFSNKRNKQEHFTVSGYNSAMNRLNQRLGWSTEKWSYNKLTTHMFRKFFETQLTDSGMVDEHLRHFMGWKPRDPLKQIYYLANPDELEKSYLKHIGYLCLNDVEVKVLESADIKKMEERHKQEMDKMEERVKILEMSVGMHKEVEKRD